MNLTDLLNILAGKKTYLTVAALFVALFGVWQDWWKVPAEMYAALFALGLAFLRSSVARVSTDGPVPIRTLAPVLTLAAALICCP